MSYDIKDIEGVGPAYAAKLAQAGIDTTGDLLEKCATPAGRKSVAKLSGVTETLILKWANQADLMRVSGIGPQFSELLVGAGVDTIKELRTRDAANLAAGMAVTNAAKHLTRTVPSATTVGKWIAAAKNLEPALKY